jgi:inorganic pyrophosphatase
VTVRVFIQNEAGSRTKNYHDEKTFAWRRRIEVSLAYPFPYGFIVGTTAADDANVDCFVITREPHRTGQLVECDVLGLMEQFENGKEDHKRTRQADHGEHGRQSRRAGNPHGACVTGGRRARQR